MIYLPINLVHWSSSSPSVVFPLTWHRNEPPWDALYDTSVSSSSSSCCSPLAMIWSSPPRPSCSDLSIIDPWILHLDQYTSKVIDHYLRINLNFLVVFFILMPPPNFIDSTFSSSSRAHESWTNTFSSDTNYCVHNPGYHTYYDTNSWEIRDIHRWSQARYEIDYLEHTRWILKNIIGRTHNLMWPKLGLRP